MYTFDPYSFLKAKKYSERSKLNSRVLQSGFISITPRFNPLDKASNIAQIFC